MANKSFESRLNDYEIFCGAFIRNVMQNTGDSPAKVWQDHVRTKASTTKLENILKFMEVCGLIKFTKEERLDKRTYKRSKLGKRDSEIIAANLKTYFDLSSENKDVVYKLCEDGYLVRIKEEVVEVPEGYVLNPNTGIWEEPLDPADAYGYDPVTGEFTNIPEEDEVHVISNNKVDEKAALEIAQAILTLKKYNLHGNITF